MNIFVDEGNGYAKLVFVNGRIIRCKPNWMPQAVANILGKWTDYRCYSVDEASAVVFNQEVNYSEVIIDHLVLDHQKKIRQRDWIQYKKDSLELEQ